LGIREISGSRVYDNGNNNGNNTLQSISASGPLLSVGMKIGVGLR